MSVFLSKVLSLFLYPLSLGLLLVAAGGGVALWRRRIGLVCVAMGLLVLWIPSTPMFSTWIQGVLEQHYPPASIEEVPTADAIVALGGAVGASIPPREYPDLHEAADRVWHAARLYHAGKAPLVVASGGTLPGMDRRYREAPVMQEVLQSWDVPSDSVLLESRSATTYENATATAALAAEQDIDRVLLVTSALHMRRALATFRQTGLDVIPAATDHRVVDRQWTVLDVVPDAEALEGSTDALHEYVGYLVYDWQGWIA